MARTADQVQAELDALKAARNNPAAEVVFADRRIRYRSVAEIRQAIIDTESELAMLTGGAPSRVSLAQHKRGDGPTGPDPFRW